MRRQGVIVTVDPELVRVLAVLAQSYENNASMTVRHLIRQEAERQGLIVSEAQGGRQ